MKSKLHMFSNSDSNTLIDQLYTQLTLYDKAFINVITLGKAVSYRHPYPVKHNFKVVNVYQTQFG